MKSLYNRTTGWLLEIGQQRSGWLAAALLLMMAVLGLGSMLGNSATYDEVAHIPSGYVNLRFGDYRLNPEHPPLIKDLAALPLQFMNLKFPLDRSEWTTDANGEWAVGRDMLYYLGNDVSADSILFWARLPILLLALGFGIALYVILKRRYGKAIALLTLFFYALSPNYIGHATLVTTDLGISVFLFLAIVAFARFTSAPTKLNIFILSLAIAGAELVKFSAVILYPLMGLMSVILVAVTPRPINLWERIKSYVGGTLAASMLSIAWIWIYYAPQVRNMPQDVQNRLIVGALQGSGMSYMQPTLIGFTHWPVLKPIVQYFLGLSLVYGRVENGNVTYFNGLTSAKGYQMYFPELFAVKTQVAFLILLLLGIGLLIWRSRVSNKPLQRLATNLRRHVLEWSMGIFAAAYFTASVAGKLDLGIRHILPVYLPLFLLVAISTVRYWTWLTEHGKGKIAWVGFGILLVWYAVSTIFTYPSYLSYFNELIGGGYHADAYFADSSVDWGQDLKRLKSYVSNHPEIKHLALDYFGGGDAAYYFCARRYDASGELITTGDGFDCSHSVYQPWHSQNGQYTGQFIAVSETYLEYDRYYSRYNEVTDGYDYLRAMTPMAKIGNSIYLYKLY